MRKILQTSIFKITILLVSILFIGFGANAQYAPTDDFDGDGIVNKLDIDMDNDGVPNAIEAPSCYYTKAELSMPIAISTQMTNGASNPITLAIDGLSSTNSSQPTGQNWVGKDVFKITMPEPIVITGLDIEMGSGPFSQNATSTFKLQGSTDNLAWSDLSVAASNTLSSQTITIVNTLQPTTAYKYYRIIGVAGTASIVAIKEIKAQMVATNFSSSLFPKPTCTGADTDTDSVLNQFDLDSDGDGCSDAKEAGATTSTTANFQFSGADANNNGLKDVVEATSVFGVANYMSSYNRFALSNTVSACSDFDGDAIADVTDLDDDNDGVPDAIEAPSCYMTASEVDDILSVSTDLIMTNPIANIYDGSTALPHSYFNTGQQLAGANIFTFSMAVPVSLSSFQIDMGGSAGITGTAGGTAKLQAFNGNSWVDLSVPTSLVTSVGLITIPVTLNNGSYIEYRLLGVGTATTVNNNIAEIKPIINTTTFNASQYPKSTCGSLEDADGDGKKNNVDLDSDNDGCSDAFEANATEDVTITTFPGPYGTNGLDDTLESTVDKGLINYGQLYTYRALSNTVNACTNYTSTVLDCIPANLEMSQGAGNPAISVVGPVLEQGITLQDNTDNPSTSGGTVFTAFTPDTKVVYSLTNQQYTGVASGNTQGNGLLFGYTSGNATDEIYPATNFEASSVYTNFSSQDANLYKGISLTANNGINLFVTAGALQVAAAPTKGRYYYGDLNITFTRPVSFPVLHLSGVSDKYNGLGFTTEFELISGQTMNKLSGDIQMILDDSTFTTIANDQTVPTNMMDGSYRVDRENVTSLKLKIFLKGDGLGTAWSGTTGTTAGYGDNTVIGVSIPSHLASPPTISNPIAQNNCPSPLANLTATVTGSPLFYSVEWHTSPTPTDANLVTDPTGVPSGTYYAFHRSPTGCLSTASTPVTTKVIPCTITCLVPNSISGASGGDGQVDYTKWRFHGLGQSGGWYDQNLSAVHLNPSPQIIKYGDVVGSTKPTTSAGRVPANNGIPESTPWYDAQSDQGIGHFVMIEGYFSFPCFTGNLQIRTVNNGKPPVVGGTPRVRENYSTLHLSLANNLPTIFPGDLKKVASQKTDYSGVVEDTDPALAGVQSQVFSTSNLAFGGKWVRFAELISNGTLRYGSKLQWSIDGAPYVDIPSSSFTSITGPNTISSCPCFVVKKLGGTIFNDTNGLTDNTVNGTGINPGSLSANLLDVDGNVVATIPVNADGTYQFLNVIPMTYTVQISTNAGTPGLAAPTQVLPTGWLSTGENNATAVGSDGTINGLSAPVTVGTLDVTNVNFGIEQPPVPLGSTAPSQLNPGGTISAPVPATIFTGTDPAGGTITAMTITAMPANATSITVGGTTYGPNNTPFPVGGITILTNAAGNPIQAITVDPIDGAVNVTIPFTVTDNAGVVSPTTSTATVPFTLGSLAGNVFNDTNGNTDSDVNGTGLNPGGLNANLLDAAGKVVATVPVNADGTYNFPNLNGATYTVQISTAAGTIGSLAPAQTLPTGWVNTGDEVGATQSGTVNGVSEPVTLTAAIPNATNINFGIEQPPVAVNDQSLDNNPNSIVTVDVLINDSDVTALVPTSVKILTPGTGVPVTSLVVPGEGTWTVNPTTGAITFAPQAGFGGNPTPINYTVADAAGKIAQATVTITYKEGGVALGGNVYNDLDALLDNTVDGSSSTVPATLFANLYDAAGVFVESVPVVNGVYLFPKVSPNKTYTVAISTVQGVAGSSPSSTLPTGWVNTGENIGPAAGNDGTVNGIQTVAVTSTDILNANFGIEQLPTPVGSTAPAQLNPGGTTTAPVPANIFTGTDPNGGIITSLTITTFPTNATSITINGVNYTAATFPPAGVTVPTDPTGQPTQPILVDPIDGVTNVAIPFVVTDNAGKVSPTTSTANVPFILGSLSGNVFDDANGSTDADVNGTGLNPGGLNANLLDAAGKVVATTPINADGTYSFTGLNAGDYTVQISTVAGTPTQTAPAQTLPTGWLNTGDEIVAAQGTTPNGVSEKVTLSTTNPNQPNVNFGIEQPPVATDNSLPVQVNPGGTTQVPAPVLAGTDPEDGVPTTVKISTLPDPVTEGILYYNGTPVTAGQIIPNFDPTKLTVDPVTTAGIVDFTFTVIDKAGVEDPTPATASMSFKNLNLSGNVYTDLNGATGGVDGSPYTGADLSANLIDALGKVVATVPVAADGTYNFTGLTAGTFTVQISTNPGVIGSTAPLQALPSTYANTGDEIGTTQGTTPNGVSEAITLTTADVTNVNFGIVQPPIANDDSKLANPVGSTVGVNLLTNDKTADGTTALPAEVTVDLDPAPGLQTMLMVPGEGTYTYNPSTGDVTFIPEPTFTKDPTPIPYTLTEIATGLTDPATITIEYVPVATDDTKTIVDPTLPTTVSPLTNDTTGDTVVPTTLKLIDPANPTTPVTSVVVPNEGTWTVNPDGTVTFDPLPGFETNPTPINYVVSDNDGNTTSAKITLIAPPVANDDEKLSQPAGPVSLPIVNPNDILGNGTPAIFGAVVVDLNPSTPGPDNTLVVPGEGTWTYVPATGVTTFTPEPTFTLDPTPIPYTITETATGLTSPTATITIDYVPVAKPDTGVIPANSVAPVDVNPLTNDKTGDTPEPTSVKLIDPITSLPVTSVTVPEGTWTVNPTTGIITFVPLTPTSVAPAPIGYVVSDNDGNTTTSTVTLTKAVALPVTLVSFAAQAALNAVNLTWKAANEKGFSHFEVQKSADAKEFGSIGIVKGSKSSIYQFEDINPLNGDNYYRLKMIDFDGNSKYSKIVNSRFEESLYWTMENPAINGQFNLLTNAKAPGFSIYNAAGNKLNYTITEISSGKYSFKVDSPTTGIYFLVMKENGKSNTKKLLIEN